MNNFISENIAFLIKKNDLASFRFWNEKAADSSYVEGVFGYASYIGEENSKYGFTFDPVKSYALLSNLLELNGGGNVIRDVNDTLPDIEKNLSKEQLKKAKAKVFNILSLIYVSGNDNIS